MRILFFILSFYISIDFIHCQEKKSMGGIKLDLSKLPGNIYLCSFPTGYGIGCNNIILNFCPNDSFQLEISDGSQPGPCVDYQWKRNGIIISPLGSHFCTVSDTGIYSVTVDCNSNGWGGPYTIGNFKVVLTTNTVNCGVAGIKVFNSYNNEIKVYPNPNSGSFKLQIYNEIENGELILINSLGQTVHEQKIVRGENQIMPNKVSSGLYYYIILQNKQQVGNGKLIVE